MKTSKRPRINRQKLKALREARGWSGPLAAANIGISHQALTFLERGHVKRPNPLTLAAIAKTYGVPIADLVS